LTDYSNKEKGMKLVKYLTLSAVTAGVLLSTGCFKEKELPAEQLITIYDSNMQETLKIAPLETVYVKVAGLEPNQLHKISILDADGNEVSFTQLKSDDTGVIGPVPVWYDVGLQKDENGNYVIKQGLDLKAFYVRVQSLENKDTDFKQDFFLLLKKPDSPDELPKPIVEAVDNNGNIINTFMETGTKTPDGEDDNLTKVYVKAQRLPAKLLDGSDVKSVDIYIVPTGDKFQNGMDLEAMAITSRKDVPVKLSDNKAYTYIDTPVLVWDLNKGPYLINPNDNNNAYSVIVDVNRNGKLDIGEDLDGDGVFDKFIDGIDGQGVAGFIVMNTEANELNFDIKDENANSINSMPEAPSGERAKRYFEMKNIPTSNTQAKIYVIDVDAVDLPDGYTLSDVRKNASSGSDVNITAPDNNTTFMPYIKPTYFLSNIGDNYSYDTDIDKSKNLDIVVDMNENGQFDKGVDYYLPNAVNVIAVDNNYTTAVSPTENSTIFNEARSESNTTIYIRINGGSNTQCASNLKTAYFFKGDTNIQNGDELFNYIYRKDISDTGGCADEFLNVTDLWPEYKIINPTDKNNKYFIIIDKNGNHEYDEGIDVRLDVAFRDVHPTNDLPNVNYINIASGGVFKYSASLEGDRYDYRDIFTVDAEDTLERPWYGVYKGVKAIWNPHIRGYWWWYWWNHRSDHEGLWYGDYVDLYIIDADKYPLTIDMKLSDDMDVRGYHQTLPVQYSCSNGWHQQDIWRAPLKPGRYYVIVDKNRNGKLDEGIDFVDAVRQDGTTAKQDPSVVGFSVVE
jgi:hypothetical protein